MSSSKPTGRRAGPELRVYLLPSRANFLTSQAGSCARPESVDYSSLVLRPRRSRQLRRRSGVPTRSASAVSGFESVEVFMAGGFGVVRPLRVPLVFPPVEEVPPTRRRVGVRRIPVPLLS